MDNSIHPSVVIIGEVSIGKNVYIGPNCIIGEFSYQLCKSQIKRTIIGDGCKISGGSIICQGAELLGGNRIDHQSYIGENSVLGVGSVLEYGGRIYERVRIGSNCFISGFVCNDSVIGDNCVVQGDLIHRFVNVDPCEPECAPALMNDVFVGRSAQIIGPVVLSERSYIAAGAVVTKDTSVGKLYMGVPARCAGDSPSVFKLIG